MFGKGLKVSCVRPWRTQEGSRPTSASDAASRHRIVGLPGAMLRQGRLPPRKLGDHAIAGKCVFTVCVPPSADARAPACKPDASP